jgi:hypothetical protein
MLSAKGSKAAAICSGLRACLIFRIALISDGFQLGLQAFDFFVSGFDFEGFFRAFGAYASGFHFRDFGADMDLRYSVDALRLQRAVVDSFLMTGLLQCAIGIFGPLFTPCFKELFVVPAAIFEAETFVAYVAHTQQNVAMRVFCLGAVDGHVGYHADIHEMFLREAAH